MRQCTAWADGNITVNKDFDYDPQYGYGYWLDNVKSVCNCTDVLMCRSELDDEGEWFFDYSTSVLYYYTLGSPSSSSFVFSILPYGITVSSSNKVFSHSIFFNSQITISGISVQYQMNTAVKLSSILCIGIVQFVNF